MTQSDGEPEAYWYNIETGQVEFGRKTSALNRIGPFKTSQEAARALEILRDRTSAWNAEEESD
jgi:hypothetical protein